MLSLEDLQSQLRELLNINSIESTFSDEFFTDLINEQRALFIKNEYNKNRSIDPYIVQEIPCFEMELADPHNCCVAVPAKCKILKSKYPLPNTIEFHFSKGIQSVGPVDFTKPRFNLTTINRIPYIGHGRTTSHTVYAFIHANYLYVTSKNPAINTLKYVSVTGIFEDPTSLKGLISCDARPCWSPADPYPLNSWMWVYMKQQIINQVSPKLMLPTDDNNDTEDANTERGQVKQ